MQWQRHPHVDYAIQGYQAGCIQVNQQRYQGALIVHAKGVNPNWVGVYPDWKMGLDQILSLKPSMILLGLGLVVPLPLPYEWIVYAQEKGAALEIMTTPAACRTFNILLGDGRDVVAGLQAIEKP